MFWLVKQTLMRGRSAVPLTFLRMRQRREQFQFLFLFSSHVIKSRILP